MNSRSINRTPKHLEQMRASLSNMFSENNDASSEKSSRSNLNTKKELNKKNKASLLDSYLLVDKL